MIRRKSIFFCYDFLILYQYHEKPAFSFSPFQHMQYRIGKGVNFMAF